MSMGKLPGRSANLDALALEIRRSWHYKILQELSVYRKSTGEKETDMLKRFLEVKNAGGDLPEEWQRGIHMSWPIVRPIISTLTCRFRG
jgi:hypothetical protein